MQSILPPSAALCGHQVRWILYGRLTDYSVAEVLSNWCLSKERESAGYRGIDLDGVSVIDRSGQRVLSMMIQDGARFGGIYARYLLEALQELQDRALNSIDPG